MGHYMEVNYKTYGFTSYFSFNPICTTLTDDYVIKTMQAKLEKSINLRLLSDRPIACLLSGGLDSSIISCYIS